MRKILAHIAQIVLICIKNDSSFTEMSHISLWPIDTQVLNKRAK